MRRLFMLLALVALALVPASAGTIVRDTLYDAYGNRATGSCRIAWIGFTTAGGQSVAAGVRHIQIRNGVLLVELEPTAGGTPANVTYGVRCTLANSVPAGEERWVVPTSSTPVTLAQVRVTPVPVPAGGVNIASVTGLYDELQARPTKGAAWTHGAAARIDEDGEISAVSGDPTNCVLADGTSTPCAAGGASGFATLTGVPDDNAALASALAAKQATLTGGATSIASADLPFSRALISDGAGKVAASAVTSTELAHLAGVSSGLQGQLDGKAPTSHAHAAADVTSGIFDAARLPAPGTTTLGGVKRNAGAAGEYVSGIDTDGSLLFSTPAGGGSASFAALTGVPDDNTALASALSGKQATITGAASSVTSSDLTASRVVVSDVSGKLSAAATTSTELGYVSGVTSGLQAQLNALSSAIAGKQATLTGAATSIASADLPFSRALISDGAGKVAASAVTSTELGYLAGVSSGLQGQLDALGTSVAGKQATITGAASTVTSSNLSTSRAVVSDGSGKLAASAVTATELDHLAGVSSGVQGQLDGKAPTSHAHAAADTTSGQFDAARMPASADTNARVAVKVAGSAAGTRRSINFAAGMSCTDDAGNEEVDCTVTGGGGSGVAVEADEAAVATATIVNFKSAAGALLVVTDAGAGQVDVQNGPDTAVMLTRTQAQRNSDRYVDLSSADNAAYTGCPTPPLDSGSIGAGMELLVKMPAANNAGGANTIDFCSLGAVAWKQHDGSTDPGAAAHQASRIYRIVHDGTLWVDSPAAAAAGGSGDPNALYSGTVDFGSIPDGGCSQQTFTATGLAAGSTLALSLPSTLNAGLMGTAIATASDTAAVRLCNLSGAAVDPASATFKVRALDSLGYLKGSGSIDFGAIADGACLANTITVSGAATGDNVSPGWPSALNAGLTGAMFVSAGDTVAVRLCNFSGAAVDPANLTFAAAITK